MKKTLFRAYARRIILFTFGCLLAVSNLHAIDYKYKGCLVSDKSVIENMSISLNAENPEYFILRPVNKRIEIRGMKSSEFHNDGTWDEVYNTNLRRVSIILKKDREKGLYRVCIHKRDNILYFEPDKSDKIAVTEFPSLFINNIQFANVDKKGKIIDNYGEVIIGAQVKNLSMKVAYQTLIPDSLITLDIKLFDPNGKLMTNAYSPEGFSYAVSFKTGDDIADLVEQSLGSWKAKFRKGSKLEIHHNAKLLVAVNIPTKGLLSYRPILVRVGPPKLGIRTTKVGFPKISKRPFVYRDLYKRGYLGPFGRDYIITGWRIQEE